ncbi:hypothetical protein RJT34_21646 [Clitoria ternatea]|uniref:TIR domain-containing protein n=1 Tax=Clitoria ternatea TaxID=43366 RepID=A0AAN9P5Y3_CLITE
MANHQLLTSSATSSLKTYDVFLSFRGEDTRINFTSHLHDALIQKKIETYIDYRLEKGDEISQALLRAIEESLVSVVIFSQDYASSKWCLDEISKIMECKKDDGQVVVPVFYQIDPSHVRKQMGAYEEAFTKHEADEKISCEKLQKWRAALTQAANLAGWDSRTYRNESEFIKAIVTDVLKKLNLKLPIELKGLVGIEENYVEVESLLKIGSREVLMIGIWGMGGIGKTTLATALHVNLYSEFEGHCFLANVREQSEKYGLDALRNKLFSELLEEENLRVNVPKIQFQFVARRLRRKKVFIVLDDVATSEQLEDLIDDYDCLGEGSRVIVTTRDKHIFSLVDGIHEVKELNNHNSLQLFCLNAFREKHPKNGYEELSKNVIAYCKGNPLALKVLGARLRSRTREIWKCELRKLQKIPNVKICNVLRLSFDDLDHTEQDIFLDIACFFKGEYRDHVTSILEACDLFPDAGIEVLLDKSLISISKKLTIEMHDLIQEMGWNIVHQESKDPGRRSRLWDPEEVFDVLKYDRGSETIEGIILDMSKIEDLYLSLNSFTKMTNIRFIKFYYGNWSGKCKIYLPNGLKSLSNKLRYLQWHGYCLESLPSTFCAKSLVELSMPYSNLGKLWEGVQNLVNLKEIDLRFCNNLVEVPDLSMATNLEELSLAQCKSLHQVHPSILSLDKLQDLDLEGCTEIESLQTNNHLKSLRNIRLSNCSSLKEFSVSSENLERLWLDGTSIQELPSSIWRSEKLMLIDLNGCDYLNSVENKVSYAFEGSLNSLVLSRCKQLNAWNLCSILDSLPSLTLLRLENCENLQALPDNIGLLSSLERLILSGSNVEILSPNIKNLVMLKELKLDNCRKLVSLPKLPQSLQVLSAVNCISLVTDFTQLQLSFSLKHALGDRPASVFLPGDQVPDGFSFQSKEASVTIPYVPLFGLCGFIFCLILSQSLPDGKYGYVVCHFSKHSKRIGGRGAFLGDQNLILDHVFVWYYDIRAGGNGSLHRRIQKSEVWDPYNILFEFFLDYGIEDLSTKGIKGCGVYPIYATEQKGLEHEFKGGLDIVELESNDSKGVDDSQPIANGFRVEGSNHNHEEDQNKKLQQVMDQTIKSGDDCKTVLPSLTEEDSYISSTPKNQINSLNNISASNINYQTIEVLEEKDLTNNEVDKYCESVMLEKAQTLVNIDNLHQPEWDPIAELESMLCESSTIILETKDEGPNVAATLEELEILLDTSLEVIFSNNEVKQKFHNVLKQLGKFEDHVLVKLHPLIYKLKTFIEGHEGFMASQKTIHDYDQLLQSRSLLSKQLESAKAQRDQINSKISRGKIQFENITSEIVELEQKLSVLVKAREKLKRSLDHCDVESCQLKTEVAQWVPQCKTIVAALKKSETSYKVALTNKKKVEDDWADIKKTFVANKI